MELFINILGYITAILTVVMYTPQSIKILKIKTAQGLSKTTFIFLYFAYIIFVNWAPLVGLWQAWASNMPLIFVGLPILYYMFKDDIKKFVMLFLMGMASITISLVQFLVPLPTNYGISIFMSSLAGIIIGTIFIPQAWEIIKRKKIGNISIVGTLLIILGNFMWVLFYAGTMVYKDFDVALLIQLLSCIFGVFIQTPMVYFYFKNRGWIKKHIKNS